jgi:tetratricopeptide (TPR) repeat protein
MSRKRRICSAQVSFARSSGVKFVHWACGLLCAASLADDAVQLEPQNAKASVSRGLAYERMGDKEKAAGSYAKALNISCSTVLSDVPLSEDAQYAASPANIASLTDVVQHNPNDPQAYNMRGSVFGDAGRAQDALTDFNKAISLDPNYTQSYANRGLIYRQIGKPDLALADYNKSLSIDPNYAPAYLGRGMVYRLDQLSFLPLQDFNKAIQIRPDNAQAYFNRGLLYQSQHQHQFAIDDFSTAIGLSQQKAEPYLAINDSKAAAGDLEQNDTQAKEGFARVGGKFAESYQAFD